MTGYMNLTIKEIPKNHKAKINSIGASEEKILAFEDIFSWIINGEIKKMKEALKNKVYKDLIMTPSSSDLETGYSIYEIASISGNVEIMKIIHFNQESKRIYIGRALAFAVFREDLEMVKCLLSKKYQAVKNSAKCCIPLSIKNGNFEMTKELVKCFSTIKARNVHQDIDRHIRSALHIAVTDKRLDFVKLLISNYSNPRLPSIRFFAALKSKTYEIIKYFVDAGASVFMAEGYRKSCNAITYAERVFGKDIDEEARTELEKIIDLISCKMRTMRKNIADDHIAIYDDSYYYYHSKDRKNFTSLVAHILNGEVSNIDKHKYEKFLKSNSHDIFTGYRPIEFAVLKGNLEMIQHLLKLGATSEYEKNDPLGFANSAIDIAINANQKEVVNILFENGIEPKNQLYFAIKKNQLNYVEKYVGEEERNLATALELARRFKHNEIAEYLVNQGAKDNKECDKSAEESSSDSESENSEEEESEPPHCKKRKRHNSSTSSNTETSDESDTGTAKSRKAIKNVSSQSRSSQIDDQTLQKPTEVSESLILIQPLMESLLNKDFSFHGKITCLSLINTIVDRDSNACKHLVKKEIIDENAILISEIVSREDDNVNDLEIIAKILAKMKALSEGKKLITDMKLSYGAFEMLRSEMKKFEFNARPEQFAFESDSGRKIKTEEVTEIQLE